MNNSLDVFRPLRVIAATGALFLLVGCSLGPVKKDPAQATPQSDVTVYPTIDTTLGESLYPNEERSADALSAVIEQSIRRKYSDGHARRDAHPKAHGCVQAEFRIVDDIPTSLAKGIFIPGYTYHAWIRFSNGSSNPERADIKRDARGMAIKVVGVPGKKLLDDEANATTQDFIMINHPVFFATDPARYLSFMEDANSGHLYRSLFIPFDLGARGTAIALQTRNSRISNPIQSRYWSMVPYQLGVGDGRQAVKYSTRACQGVPDPVPANPEHDFLRSALRRTLQNGDACMEFLVQPRTSDRMSVEDSRIEWKETQAPFYKVATIRIPQQSFDTPEQNEFCENLSFSPWHALPEHKPLGITNRLRKVIYEHISIVRHEMNDTARQEPLSQ